MKTFASYGSLKKGYWNHSRFGLGEPISVSKIKGAMYVNPALGYPHLYDVGIVPNAVEKDYEVEIYEVEDNVFNHIDGMEQSSGYIPKEVVFEGIAPMGDITATVWFADPEYRMPNADHYVEEYAKI